MKKTFGIIFSLIFATQTAIWASDITKSADYPIRPVAFTSVKLTDKFWAPRIKTNQETTIPIALGHCYSTGRVDNFKKAAGIISGYFNTEFPFDDTDIYKIIEGASYSIQMLPNKKLEAAVDSLIEYIGAAQEPDGYLFTPRTAGEPGKLHNWVGKKRWEKDPDLSHELYNCGHLYEAAVAHYQATGKKSLLDIAIKNADLLVRDFGPGKLDYEPGHQIVEMGLVKMYRATGNKDYLDLAQYFLDLRGKQKKSEYSQNHIPVIEQNEAVGHAVRAVYMYSGMADIAALTGNQEYLHAIDKIWENVVEKKYYITGGIGATAHGEAFGKNYELPNMSAYCETCAAIGNVYWNHRQFLLHGESKYYDVLERTLYNGLISGVSLTGDRFFYPNPLESIGQHERSPWFGCACCPSNICRFMPSIPGYMYAVKDKNIFTNLFIDSQSEIKMDNNVITLNQKTDYPWDGVVNITVSPQKSAKFNVLIRIPGWVRNKPVPSNLYQYLDPQHESFSIKINGKAVANIIDPNGYVALNRKWKKGDVIAISFPMKTHKTIAHELVEADKGKISIERGPIVYCLEWEDNDGKVLNTVLEDNVEFTGEFVPNELNGIYRLYANAKSAHRAANSRIIETNKKITAIPYFAWANRGAGEMLVWIPRTTAFTKPANPKTICSEAKVTSSSSNKSLSSVNDSYWPSNSNDRETPFFSLWPKKNSEEWVEFSFDKETEFSSASVYWYDDRPWGGCRVPKSWKIQFKNSKNDWEDVKPKSEYMTQKDAVDKIEFTPIHTQQVRLLFQLNQNESAGIYEFEIK